MPFHRVVNVRFLGRLVAVVAILAISVYAVHAYYFRRNIDSLRQAAEKAKKDGHYARAANFYRLISSYAPDDVSLLKAYGLVLDEANQANPSAAGLRDVLTVLRKVLLKPLPDEEEYEVRKRLIDIAMQLHSYAEARDHLLALLQQLYPDARAIKAPDARAAELEQRLAYSKEVLDEKAAPGEAKSYQDVSPLELYRRAIQHAHGVSDPDLLPRLLWSYELCADLLQKQGNKDESRKTIIQLVLDHPESCEAYLGRINYLLHYGPDYSALADLEQATKLALDPASHETGLEVRTAVLVKAAQYYAFSANNPKRARSLLEETEDKFPEQADPYLMHAEIELRLNRPMKALEILRHGEQKVPKVLGHAEEKVPNPQLNLLLYGEGTLLFDQGMSGTLVTERIQQILSELNTQGARDYMLEELKGRNAMHEVDFETAASDLERVRAHLPSGSLRLYRVQTLRGLCYEKLGKPDQALEIYAEARDLQSDDIGAQARYAYALAGAGRPEEARDQLERLFERKQVAGIAMARLLLRLGKMSAEGKKPELSVEDAREVGKYLDAAEGTPNLSAELRAEIMGLRIEAAPLRIETARLHPETTDLKDYRDEVLFGALLGSAADKVEEAAISFAALGVVLDELDNGFPGFVWVALFSQRAELLAGAEAHLRHAITLPGAENSTQPWATLARFLATRQKDEEGAKAVIQKDMKNRLAPENLPLMQAICYEAIEKYQQANRAYEEAVQKAAPVNRIPLHALVDFYTRRARLDNLHGQGAILDHIKTLGARTESPASAEELARLAILVLQSAGTPSPTDLKKAADFLESARSLYPRSLELQLHLADVHELQGDYATAKTLYREILERDSGNAPALNNLAWLLAMHGGQPDDAKTALELINKAIEANPLPEFRDTRAQIYLRLKRPQQAVADLRTAVAEKPCAAYLFHLAQAQWQDQNRAEAVADLQRAQKEFSLQKANLHPLEQKAYDELVEALKDKS
jgi:Tfp pilus assembly protein PilF